MTKASPARKARRTEKKLIAPVKRNLTPEECFELKQRQQLIASRYYEAGLIKNNSALVPRGQQVAEEIEAIARLLDNAKHQWLRDTLLSCGYESGFKCDINLDTGEVIPVKDEPANPSKA